MKKTRKRPSPVWCAALFRRDRGACGGAVLVTVAVLMALTGGLLSIGYRKTQRAAEAREGFQALFTGDSAVEEARMRLSPGAPAAARIAPEDTAGWRVYILSGRTRAEIAAGLDPAYGKSQMSGYAQPEATGDYVFVDSVQGRGGIPWGWVRIEHKISGAGQILRLDPRDGGETAAAGHPPILLVTAQGVGGRGEREVRAELRPVVQPSRAPAGTPRPPLAPIPAGLANLGPLSLGGHRLMMLTEGTYWFSSLSITESAQLQTRGAVTLYVTGPIRIAADGIRTSRNYPANLVIHGTADPADPARRATAVEIAGVGRFHGAVFAPEADIVVSGGAEVFGALKGRTLSLAGGGALHVDETLRDPAATPAPADPASFTIDGYRRHVLRTASAR